MPGPNDDEPNPVPLDIPRETANGKMAAMAAAAAQLRAELG